jgi:hypothetical protein
MRHCDTELEFSSSAAYSSYTHTLLSPFRIAEYNAYLTAEEDALVYSNGTVFRVLDRLLRWARNQPNLQKVIVTTQKLTYLP